MFVRLILFSNRILLERWLQIHKTYQKRLATWKICRNCLTKQMHMPKQVQAKLITRQQNV